jgi:hypothetical protein
MAIAIAFTLTCIFVPVAYLLYRAMTDNDKPEDSSIFNKF